MKSPNWYVGDIEKIESVGTKEINTIKVSDIDFSLVQREIIQILRTHDDYCTSYGKLYLAYLEKQGIINIKFMPKVLKSPETIDRIRRKLFEYAENGNKELAFLLKYRNRHNEDLDNDSRKFHRDN